MPTPRKDEKQDDYISRCMGSEEAQKDFPDQDQRAAFYYSKWRESKASADIAEAMFGNKENKKDDISN